MQNVQNDLNTLRYYHLGNYCNIYHMYLLLLFLVEMHTVLFGYRKNGYPWIVYVTSNNNAA